MLPPAQATTEGFVKTSQTVAMALIVFVAEMSTWANEAGRTRPADTRLSSTVHGEIVIPSSADRLPVGAAVTSMLVGDACRKRNGTRRNHQAITGRSSLSAGSVRGKSCPSRGHR